MFLLFSNKRCFLVFFQVPWMSVFWGSFRLGSRLMFLGVDRTKMWVFLIFSYSKTVNKNWWIIHDELICLTINSSNYWINTSLLSSIILLKPTLCVIPLPPFWSWRKIKNDNVSPIGSERIVSVNPQGSWLTEPENGFMQPKWPMRFGKGNCTPFAHHLRINRTIDP